MKILSIVGARPQFIKASMLLKQQKKDVEHFLLHTGQHYDSNMSEVFFDEMGIYEPDFHYKLKGSSQLQQLSSMFIGIEKFLTKLSPNLVIVYGDTNTTLAGAITSSRLGTPLAHIESGLRSFNKEMPEEINRIIADNCSDILFCPTDTAVHNLYNEGIKKNVYNVGDIMLDSFLFFKDKAESKSNVLEKLDLVAGSYSLLTLHRPYNVDNMDVFSSIISGIINSHEKIIWPVHPRTKKTLGKYILNKSLPNRIKIIEPVGYFDMIKLESHSKKIITDSGGVQKEAYFLRKPCISIRSETEWTETIEDGWNTLVSTDSEEIADVISSFEGGTDSHYHYGRGTSSSEIMDVILGLYK